MNRLEIVQLVNTLAGTQGLIDTTVSTSGYQATLVAMVDKAYWSIQTHRDNWSFMRAEITPTFTSLINTYTNTAVAKYNRLIYDQRELRFVEYDSWILRDHNTTEPEEWTVNPATNVITINPLDDDYDILIQYHRKPDVMTANTSIPIIPTEHHMVIVFHALIALGSYLANQSLISSSTVEYSTELGRLQRSQVPQAKIVTRPFV